MSPGRAKEQMNQATPDDVGMVVERLQRLLARQLELVRQGNLIAAETLCEQTGPLVRAMATSDAFYGTDGEDRRRSLEPFYRELCLTLTAQRKETSNALQAVRRGKRMLRTYGSHVSAK